jgi:hypothetical protein
MQWRHRGEVLSKEQQWRANLILLLVAVRRYLFGMHLDYR